jgi:hypothetical protein
MWKPKHWIRAKHGSWLTYEQAKSAAQWANKKYPEIDHWVEG